MSYLLSLLSFNTQSWHCVVLGVVRGKTYQGMLCYLDSEVCLFSFLRKFPFMIETSLFPYSVVSEKAHESEESLLVLFLFILQSQKMLVDSLLKLGTVFLVSDIFLNIIWFDHLVFKVLRVLELGKAIHQNCFHYLPKPYL